LALTASWKPFARSSVVLMPGWTLTIGTLPPFGASWWMASNAALPPPRLSDAMADAATEGSFSVVSTSTTLMFCCTACWIGCCMAETSVGAIRIAFGAEAITDCSTGVCSEGSNFCGPLVVTSAPTFAASSWMPHCIVT
jgi:hypothetical protein